MLSNFLLLRYLESYICNSVAELRVNKKHPDLIPYSSLPDSEKEYDRLMALDTIKLVKKLGFEIVKSFK